MGFNDNKKKSQVGQLGVEDCLFFCCQSYCSHFSTTSGFALDMGLFLRQARAPLVSFTNSTISGPD